MAGLLVAGTSSDAGKSLVVTGLCRAFARTGVKVAPYKAQNMSNNSMVCRGGGEIGRAQYLQAEAAGVDASPLMNPVLLKPGSDRRAFVVVNGQPAGELMAGEYATGRRHLAEAAFAAYEKLGSTYELVVAEGAGSPAEINLRRGDYVNMGLARRFSIPTVVVGDIDRGGVLASMYGTWALLDADDRALLRAFVVNKFRGDQSVLDPGLEEISRLTGVPFVGVLPWLDDVWLDSEDALAIAGWRSAADQRTDRLSVAVVRFPRVSNTTDVDALAAEPGVDVVVTADPDVVAGADLVVLPGTRATIDDLSWLRSRRLDTAIVERARTHRPILGICGGYQMLATSIDDPYESGRGVVPGLGLIPATVRFDREKVLARPTGTYRGMQVEGYEIHQGIVTIEENFPGGVTVEAVTGTIWHGAFECDPFRRAFLSDVAAQVGSRWSPDPEAHSFASRRLAMIDRLADAVETHLDLPYLLDLSRRV